MNNYYRDSIFEVNLDTIKDNIVEIKDKCSKDDFLYVVVKADAYGHGIIQVSKTALEAGGDGLGVVTLDEALTIRKHLKDAKVLCMGVIPDRYYEFACENDITVSIANLHGAAIAAKADYSKPLLVQLKINTGLNRIGLGNLEDVKEAISILQQNDKIVIEGIFAHFATSEDDDKNEYTQMQADNLKYIVDNVDHKFKQIHCTNSAALLRWPNTFDFTNTNRTGVGIYGISLRPEQSNFKVKSAVTVKSLITQVHVHPAGTKIGYSNTYITTEENEIVATIAIGYADGFARSHKGSKVKCGDQYGTIVSNICMDQLMIKFEKPVSIGDEVILISTEDPEVDVYQRAKQAESVPQEILPRFGLRLVKVYTKNGEVVEVDNTLLNK